MGFIGKSKAAVQGVVQSNDLSFAASVRAAEAYAVSGIAEQWFCGIFGMLPGSCSFAESLIAWSNL